MSIRLNSTVVDGAGGVAGLSMNIAYVLFVVFLILLVVHFFTGRGRRI